MKGIFFRPFFFLLVPLIFLSCTEELDFDQFDDLSVTPTLASGLFYLESTEEFINTVNVSGVFYEQTFNFDPFNEQFVAERLLEGTLSYEIENTTSKRITLFIEFLDEADTVLDTESFTVDPAPSGTLTREVAYGPAGRNIDILTTTSSLRVTGGNLSDTTSTSSESEPKIILRSAAEFLFRLK
ncbi:hypothetical protein [Flagellimonas nanhaiensis]|uniref:Uncharacterized protein n=1 Tax=Flagellimonas nanhaiensis TaxID=2292706 RepID=A0A371JS78_9FLAO|nr:hypothetical protein [Allomuricauda nanhaiensis]RDY60673.1 hypothetical protein DX873_00390 [Allomuricauda nanhaiensis]